MPRDKSITRDRYIAVRKAIQSMFFEKSDRGAPKYTPAYVYDVVGEKIKLSTRTIINIWRKKDTPTK